MDNRSGAKSWLDSIHSISPYLAWVVSRVGSYTRDVWFIVPALALSFAAVGVLAGFDVMMDSIAGLVSVFPLVFEWAVSNPWAVFSVWLVSFIVFAWDMEWWTYDDLSRSEWGILKKVYAFELVGFWSGIGVGAVLLDASLGSLLLVGSVYVVSMWMASGYLWRLMVYDEAEYNVQPLKSVWLVGTRVPLVFGVFSYVFSPWSGLPVIVSVGISLLPPLFVGGYFVWRFKALPSGGSGGDGETLDEAGDDEFYRFEV
jgi:hypothetical protein